MFERMSKEALVSAVKAIVAQQRAGDVEGSYEGYAKLYSSPEFAANKPEDQRQALKLLILAKRYGQPSEKLIEAHRAAIPALTELVSTLNEPEDYELLGICHQMIGNEEAASNMFRQGLTLERARNPQSDLCGRLMTRVASI
jgi:tetratricopeptide (TPR) repeat protein